MFPDMSLTVPAALSGTSGPVIAGAVIAAFIVILVGFLCLLAVIHR